MIGYLVSGKFSDYYGLVFLAVIVIYVVAMNRWYDRKEANDERRR